MREIVEKTTLTLGQLQAAHIERQEEWCPDQKPDLSFRGNEMAGEVGEACNVIKKLERERHGWRGSRATKEQLAEELADVVHTAVLCAITAGIDLEPAVVAKFNSTSEKNGLASRLSCPPPAGADEARQIIRGFLDCFEVADCAPEDLDNDTRDVERRARKFLASPPASAGAEAMERLVKALEAAETYVIDGVTTAKQNLEMNAAYPARKPRYEAELQEARDIYAECQAARRAALAAAKDKP
ncbi:hypothetical protein GOB91_07125 [Sinorhizobium meliloti]|nr:hypothetical protein [Sinorhizobium meliloti]MDW9731355.1 hypothetical protein [Sinorhizobium meliloti]MDW9896615.1 hypothetical protein [Sinorhizobium meliloti]MQX32595.1 hypothetical protein [Sinorhizobium meliloti]RVK93993.1 hypothetical protein CN150_19100 [Sinorhizobium meliloti]